MGLPEWLTVPVAEVSRGYESRGPKRIGCLCFVADPMPAEHLRRLSTTGFDPDSRVRADRCEFVDPGSLIPFVPHADEPLDRHRLDVALSRGRHAAERAKLAGCCKLLCLGIGADDALDDRQPFATSRPTRQAAYAGLRRIARFEIAALTGALIAGAQMGLQAYPGGRQARFAAELALALNPGVRDWLIDSPGAIPQPRLGLSHLCPMLVPKWNRLRPRSASTDGVGLF
ncbi:hypothetical protein Atep_21260 [Allochromatium tepidum]|uniref:Uncharacterized protein n=1 Tax=Allochromatium tepidum TaxID=553982 RepID=A0ABM7QNW3_9GAMM|nr:hypothetical protein Atep_21260 [Allochromatium tepidum]